MKTTQFAFVCLISVFVSVARPAHADLISEIPSEFVSPVTTKAAPIFFVGAGLAASLILLEDSVSDPLQREARNGHLLDTTATDLGVLAGSYIPNVVYALGMASVGYASGDSNARERAILMTKSSIYAGTATTILKTLIHQRRPDGSDSSSFPSGHATSAFSFASIVGAEHDWYWGALAYSYAALVSYGRMSDNRHYLHDVVAGATIGISYGVALQSRRYRESPKTNVSLSTFQILPTNELDGAVALYSRRF
jgi:membrane-associated phospholipid phosphatase